MKYKEFNPVFGCGCVVRTFIKVLDKDASIIKNDLEAIANELGFDEINEIEIFDEYYKRNHYFKKYKRSSM